MAPVAIRTAGVGLALWAFPQIFVGSASVAARGCAWHVAQYLNQNVRNERSDFKNQKYFLGEFVPERKLKQKVRKEAMKR